MVSADGLMVCETIQRVNSITYRYGDFEVCFAEQSCLCVSTGVVVAFDDCRPGRRARPGSSLAPVASSPKNHVRNKSIAAHCSSSSSTLCIKQRVARCSSLHTFSYTIYHAILRHPFFSAKPPPSKLEHFAWHDAVNARILHTHSRNLCRRLLDCALGPRHSIIRACHIRLGPRCRHTSCEGFWVVVRGLRAVDPTLCVSRCTRDRIGESNYSVSYSDSS